MITPETECNTVAHPCARNASLNV